MATRRIAKSTVDWAALTARVPTEQQVSLRAFKTRHDSYVSKLASYPEEVPKIDWEFYRSRIPVAGLTEQLQKAMSSVKVPYPEDKLTQQVDAQEQETIKDTQSYIQGSVQRIEKIKGDLKKWEEMLPIHKMTEEEMILTFPDHAWGLDQKKYQTLYPHDYDPRIGVIPWEEGSGMWNFGPNRKKDLQSLKDAGH